MYVCMYVYVCVCVNVNVCACACGFVHIYVNVYMCVCVWINLRKYVCVCFGGVQDVRALGIEVPILPGIMPIQDYAWWDKTTKMAKTIVPPFVHQGLEPIKVP